MHNRKIRSVRIQMAMIGGMLGGGLVLAAVIATQRGWFEGFVQEKYMPPGTALAELLRGAGPDLASRMSKLTPQELGSVYDGWMTDDAWATPEVARACFAADAARFAERARRTLVAGNAAQKLRAVRFLRDGGHPAGAPFLRRAAERARRTGEAGFAREAEEALKSLGG